MKESENKPGGALRYDLHKSFNVRKHCVYNVSASQTHMLPGGHSLTTCPGVALSVVPTFKTKVSPKHSIG